MKSVVIFAVALLALTFSVKNCQSGKLPQINDNSAFFKHYAKFKVQVSCFGETVMNSWKLWVENMMKECQDELHDRYDRSVDTKEEQYFSADKIRTISERMKRKIMFLNCTLAKLNISMTPEGSIDAKHVTAHYQSLEIDRALREDLIEGVEQCAKVSACEEMEESFGAMDEDLQKKIHFVKCEQRARLKACIMKDLRAMKDHFDFSGLDGALDELDDDEKMFAIALAKMSMDRSQFII